MLGVSKMRLLITLTLIFHCTGFAQETVPFAELKETIEKISRVREALKISAQQSQTCDTPRASSCTFESYCGELSSKAQDFYIYQDASGHRVQNIQMLKYVGFAEFCAQKPFPQAMVDDPFAYPAKFFEEKEAGGAHKLKKNQELLKKETARAESIFNEAKAHIIQALSARKNAQNRTQIDNMITRLRETTFNKTAAPSFPGLAIEGCEMPNAFYRPEKNQITLCPQFLNNPDASLFSILAHELGHAIDPCSMAMDYSPIGAIYPGWTQIMAESRKVSISSISEEKNPLREVISCLRSPSSMDIKIPSKEGLLRLLDEDHDALLAEVRESAPEDGGGEGSGRATDAMEANYLDRRIAVQNNYDQFKYCEFLSGSGHMGEAFADWISTQALASKIKNIPDSGKAREYAFSSQVAFFAMDCENFDQAGQEKMRSISDFKECASMGDLNEHLAAEKEGSEHSSSHPQTNQRINRVYFTNPEIKKALGCQGGDGAQECK